MGSLDQAQRTYHRSAMLLFALPFVLLLLALLAGCTGQQQEQGAAQVQQRVSSTALTQPPEPLSALTGPELDAAKLVPLTQERQTQIAVVTWYAIETPVPPTRGPVPTEPPLDTPVPGLHSCGGADNSF